MGIGTTEWQLRAELDVWAACGNFPSGRTPHFHVTFIKCVIKYNKRGTILGKGDKSFLAY
jgi:hypothetical protein